MNPKMHLYKMRVYEKKLEHLAKVDEWIQSHSTPNEKGYEPYEMLAEQWLRSEAADFELSFLRRTSLRPFFYLHKCLARTPYIGGRVARVSRDDIESALKVESVLCKKPIFRAQFEAKVLKLCIEQLIPNSTESEVCIIDKLFPDRSTQNDDSCSNENQKSPRGFITAVTGLIQNFRRSLMQLSMSLAIVLVLIGLDPSASHERWAQLGLGLLFLVVAWSFVDDFFTRGRRADIDLRLANLTSTIASALTDIAKLCAAEGARIRTEMSLIQNALLGELVDLRIQDSLHAERAADLVIAYDESLVQIDTLKKENIESSKGSLVSDDRSADTVPKLDDIMQDNAVLESRIKMLDLTSDLKNSGSLQELRALLDTKRHAESQKDKLDPEIDMLLLGKWFERRRRKKLATTKALELWSEEWLAEGPNQSVSLPSPSIAQVVKDYLATNPKNLRDSDFVAGKMREEFRKFLEQVRQRSLEAQKLELEAKSIEQWCIKAGVSRRLISDEALHNFTQNEEESIDGELSRIYRKSVLGGVIMAWRKAHRLMPVSRFKLVALDSYLNKLRTFSSTHDCVAALVEVEALRLEAILTAVGDQLSSLVNPPVESEKQYPSHGGAQSQENSMLAGTESDVDVDVEDRIRLNQSIKRQRFGLAASIQDEGERFELLDLGVSILNDLRTLIKIPSSG